MEILRSLTFLLAAGSALAGALCLGGAVSIRLDMLTHFTPFLFLAALAALALHLTTGVAADRTTLLFALAGVAIGAGLMAPEAFAVLTAGRAAPARQTIKIIQWNLWSHNNDPAATARWIAGQGADIVVVEEVIAKGAAIPPLLASAYPYQTPCAPDLECTTMILSKVPPVEAGDYPSPDSEGRHSGAWARFGTEEDAFTVMGFHNLWPAPPGPQQAQSRLYARYMDAFDRRSLIVAGDFNATPWSFSLRRQDALFGLERRSRLLFTWPVKAYSRHALRSPFALMPIDHIYAGRAWRTVSVRRGPAEGSDHLPIVAVLTR